MIKRILSLDYETYCDLDLKKVGLYKYARHKSFRVLLLAFRYTYLIGGFTLWTSGKTYLVRPALGEEIPEQVLKDLDNPQVIKRAFNAQFERVVSGVLLGKDLDPAQWQCTMIKCASLGLPMALGNAAIALKIPQRKDKEGKSHITFFCKPCKPTKKNGMRTRNLPKHDPIRFRNFGRYCITDVDVECAVFDKLEGFPVPEKESRLWHLDQKINDRGVLMDPVLIDAAVDLYEINKTKLLQEAAVITGLDNPNSVEQLKKWLGAALDEEITTLNKDDLTSLISTVDDEIVRRVLQIREETSKSSIKKYAAMQTALNKDEYIRGVLQFYGAKTGRWSGKLIQPHNLKKNSMHRLAFARQLVLDRDIDTIELMYESLSYVLSQLIRTTFIAKPGHRLSMSDFASIESRVLAWIADEDWKLKVFRTHGKVYEAMGAKMFGMEMDEITGEWRDKAKIGELACGFQGGPAAIERMWPKHLPMPPLKVRKEIVLRWRKANSKIKQLWKDVENAAIDTVDTGQPHSAGKCTFYMKKGVLLCKLPSGRSLAYIRPSIIEGRYGPALQYYGINPKTYQWGPRPAYGGLLVENIVQGIARDALGEKMLDLDAEFFDICFHVHDEIICDLPGLELKAQIRHIDRLMGKEIKWAPGLPLACDTHTSPFYRKEEKKKAA